VDQRFWLKSLNPPLFWVFLKTGKPTLKTGKSKKDYLKEIYFNQNLQTVLLLPKNTCVNHSMIAPM